MNDFDKTFVLVFYFSFLKIKLNCDILNTEDVVQLKIKLNYDILNTEDAA